MMALPPWDGRPRLDSVFVDVCNAPPSEALMLTGQLVFAAIVRKQFDPNAPCPVVPVLIGSPHFGKSYFVETIARVLGAPKPSSLKFDHDERKMSMRAARSLVAELSEMAGLGRRENEDIKQWITDTTDAYRKPYGLDEDDHPRRFVLIGTANKHELNRDETGNKRFMPVFVTAEIDTNWAVELPQILAEAKKRFADDERAYYGLVRTAPNAVLAFNATDMAAGVGTPINDLDDLLPPILRTQLLKVTDSDKPRVSSAAVRAALDAHGVGRQFSAQKIAQWLVTRGWVKSNDSQGMRVYDAPDNFLDNSSNGATLPTVNPFTVIQH
jgi:predicted P-loop ATPase